jgi:hypothetical protein
LELTQETKISPSKFQDLLANVVLREAVYLASPELEHQLQKWLEGSLTDTKKIVRLQSSLLKYASRISSRCTPFGLFASCVTGQLEEDTQIEFSKVQSHTRATRFDMSFLAQLQLELLKDPTIRNALIFYPNTSLYGIGDHYRYIEYTFHNKQRTYALEGIIVNEYIAQVLEAASNGKTIADLSLAINDVEITSEERTEFIHQLIDNQILVSELELTVTGVDYFEKLLNRIQQIPEAESTFQWLTQLHLQLKKIDATIGNKASDYEQIIALAKEKLSNFNTKFLLQTDSFSNLKTNTLKKSTLSQLQEVLTLFEKIALITRNEKLDKFKQAFRKRYDDAEVPLTKVLDSEIGIAYGEKSYDNSNYLNDVPIRGRVASYQQVNWSRFDYLMQKKLFQSFRDGQQYIEITEEDVENFNQQWESPATFSTMIEVIPTSGEDQIFVNGFGGASGAYLLGRFAHGDELLYDHVQEILDLEQKVYPNKIVAEVVHLPEARTGNILQRANTRAYEIVYLGNSSLKRSQQIHISDILVSIKRNKIVLRSKKWNREIVPKLTNAHNFKGKPLPIYEFLCDLQNFEQPSFVGFYWNPTFLQLPYLPRVCYKNAILSKARWFITTADFETIVKKDTTLDAIEKWRDDLKLPQWVNFVERDNKLLINFKNQDTIAMLYNSVKKRASFVLEEFLFDHAVAQRGNDFHCNQYVVSFHKSKDA